jgi:hypothetical protein
LIIFLIHVQLLNIIFFFYFLCIYILFYILSIYVLFDFLILFLFLRTLLHFLIALQIFLGIRRQWFFYKLWRRILLLNSICAWKSSFAWNFRILCQSLFIFDFLNFWDIRQKSGFFYFFGFIFVQLNSFFGNRNYFLYVIAYFLHNFFYFIWNQRHWLFLMHTYFYSFFLTIE